MARLPAWYLQEGDAARPSYATCRRALAHMPELEPVYDQLVELAGGGELDARLLSLYRPPGFIVGCSQGAWTAAAGARAQVRLPGRPARGHRCLTEWGDRRVIGMSDCLWGLLDGLNDRGLAVSLTFGGRRDVGRRLRDPARPPLPARDLRHGGAARAALVRIPVHAPRTSRCWTAPAPT